MKKIFIIMITCIVLAGWKSAGYCQDESSDDNDIGQSESQISQDLGFEINGDQSQAESEVDQVDRSMDTGGSGL